LEDTKAVASELARKIADSLRSHRLRR